MTVFRRRCAVCRTPGPVVCAPCRRQFEPPISTAVRGVGHVPALFAYAGTGAKVVRALKYGDARRLVTVLADDLVELAYGGGGVGAVSWLPTSTQRRAGRGFDQSELLARAVARRLGVGCRPVLLRDAGAPQTGRDRASRLAAAGFRRIGPAPSARTLVLDDVCTTGSTIRAALDTLGDGGGSCRFMVVARTP